MSESIGKNTTSEWYTPRWIFEQLGILFDLDPCFNNHKIPSKDFCNNHFTDKGLEKNWTGKVFVNPPWSGSGNKKGAIKPWFKKFIEHGNGIIIFPSRTSCDWFQEFAPQLDAMFFPDKKVKFLNQNLEIQKQPMQAVCMGSIGLENTKALFNLGGLVIVKKTLEEIEKGD